MQPKASNRPTLAQIFTAFARIGAASFGGGLVAYLRDALVDEKKWMDEEEFLAALEIGQTLPGLNSVNVSIIAGRHLAGPMGAVSAAAGIILPGVLALVVLGLLYDRFRHNPGRLLGVLHEVLPGLLRHHVQEIDPGLLHGRDVPQHADHLLNVTLSGIGDQKVAEHSTGNALRQPMADQRAPWLSKRTP